MEAGTVTILFSALSGIAAVVGALLVARRYQKLGGGNAQMMLNTTYRELNSAFEAQVADLKRQLQAADEERARERVAFGEQIVALEVERKELRKERLQLKQDIDDMRAEVRVVSERAKVVEARAKITEARAKATEARYKQGDTS